MQAEGQLELTQAQASAGSVLEERCGFLYGKLARAAGATLALGALLGAFLWPLRPEALVAFWGGYMLVACAALGGLAAAFRRRRPGSEPRDWVRRAALAATALGAGWGFAAAVFFPGAQEQQVVIGFAVALAAAVGLPFFAGIWQVYALYAAAALAPFAVVLFAYGTDFFRMLAAGVPLLYVANVWTARELAREFASAYGARSAYRRLAADNEGIQAQLGEQLDSLLDAHREVQAYGRKLSLFSERAPIAVFEVDARATILNANPAAENLFGWASAEIVGRNLITMLIDTPDRERTERWWADFVAAGKPQSVVHERCLRRDGLALACEWTLTPLAGEGGETTSVVVQGRDITQQRAAERLRSEFTSTLSHELRTPLTSMLGSLELLRGGVLGELLKEQDDLVELAERNGKRLLDLINEVLDIEKIESGRLTLSPEPLALAGLLRESLRLNQGFADRFQVRLAIEGELPPVTVRADGKRLMQVMTNLLSNAAKFSPPGASVDVSARVEGGTVRVRVGDRGPGITPEFRSRIFGRFAQAHLADSRVKGGSGLGLAISKRLIELMDGRIGFEEREGGGTIFFFELPVFDAAASREGAAARVLVTEQDTVAAEYLSMVLEKAGYQVDTVADAAASRDLLGRWRYVAWLLASQLAETPDVAALLAELRARPGPAPAVILAGLRSDQVSAPDLRRQGVADVLLKNDSRARIVEVVGGAVSRA